MMGRFPYFTQREKKLDIRYGEEYPRSIAEQSQSGVEREKIAAGYERTKARAGLIGAKVQAVRTGMDMWTFVKPMLITGIIILFLIGPGLSAIMAILGAMEWWLWLGAIILGLLIWRQF